MPEQNAVIRFMSARDSLDVFRDHDYLYAERACQLRDQLGVIAADAQLDDDDVFDITFEREGWEDRIIAKHPELDPDLA